MVIVAGHLTVAPQQREAYLASCADVVEQARLAPGCLDFTIGADLVAAGRVNVFERWESQAALDRFRSAGPDAQQRQALLTVSVGEYVVADAPPTDHLLSTEPATS